MYFMDLFKTFDIVPWNVLEWAMVKKGIPKVLISSVCLCNGVMTRAKLILSVVSGVRG